MLLKENIVFFYIILIFKKHEFSFYFHLAGFSDLQFKVQCFQDIGHQDCIWSCICLKQEFCSKGVVFIQLKVYNHIHTIILLIRDMVVERGYRQFGCETIHPTQKLTSMNLLQMPCVMTWAWTFLTTEVVESVKGQSILSWCTLWL